MSEWDEPRRRVLYSWERRKARSSGGYPGSGWVPVVDGGMGASYRLRTSKDVDEPFRTPDGQSPFFPDDGWRRGG